MVDGQLAPSIGYGIDMVPYAKMVRRASSWTGPASLDKVVNALRKHVAAKLLQNQVAGK
jgi:hypothetical protein